MGYQVEVADAAARPTAVVVASTTWREFPALWKSALDEVWACVDAGGVSRRCRNVMLYKDDVPNVEVGVEVLEPFRFAGRVVASTLPAGTVARTVHYGPYEDLGLAHGAVTRWCAEQGRQLAGPRWEIYGHHSDNPAELETEVYYLLG